MSYKPYLNNTSSSITWIKRIPAHWEMKRLKTIISCKVSNVDKKTVEGQISVRLFNYLDVYNNDYLTNDMALMEVTATEQDISSFNVMVNDVLITKDSEDWRDIAKPSSVKSSSEDILCGYHLAILRPNVKHITGAFLFRVMQSSLINQQFQVASVGVTRYGLPKSAICEAYISVPPIKEQIEISAFLDCEISRIDFLIDKKTKLIELVNERRSALISHVVTKGLNPEAKMKDSGIEWLGTVPKGWEVKRLKTIVTCKASNVDKKTVEGQISVRLFNYLDVYNNDYLTTDMELMEATATEQDIYSFNVWVNDVLITKDSEDWRDIAKPSFVKSSSEDILCGYHLAILRPNVKHINGAFLFRIMQSSLINQQFQVASVGVTRYGLPKSAICEAYVCVPPIKEQIHITDYLDKEISKIDTLAKKIDLIIQQLRDYRLSLINEAVTGKIDLRRANE